MGIIDDLSRLSRDLGNTWQLVFGDLAGLGVRVIDATSGQASDAMGARVTFGALALVNDTFLQLIKTETHRGLEGRALAGFFTGGRIYGYPSRAEENPSDPAHPRRVLTVRDDQAAVVREIFERFVRGEARSAIARSLNERGVVAPVAEKGWGRGAINSILRNERYKGLVRWNAHEAGRLPGARGWKRKRRPDSEHVVRSVPALAIVAVDVWEAAARRLQEELSTGFGRPVGSGAHVYLVSGLLRCAHCGAPMSVVSRKRYGGRDVSRFGCRKHRAVGKPACPVGRTVATDRATSAVLGALARLATPEGAAEALARLPPVATPAEGVEEVPQDDVAAAERRIANLADALARLGWSDAVAERLRAEEQELRRLRAARRVAASPAPATAQLDPRSFAAYVGALGAALERDPASGRPAMPAFCSRVTVSSTAEAVSLSGAFDVAALAEASRRWAGKSVHAFPTTADLRAFLAVGASPGPRVSRVPDDGGPSRVPRRRRVARTACVPRALPCSPACRRSGRVGAAEESCVPFARHLHVGTTAGVREMASGSPESVLGAGREAPLSARGWVVRERWTLAATR